MNAEMKKHRFVAAQRSDSQRVEGQRVKGRRVEGQRSEGQRVTGSEVRQHWFDLKLLDLEAVLS